MSQPVSYPDLLRFVIPSAAGANATATEESAVSLATALSFRAKSRNLLFPAPHLHYSRSETLSPGHPSHPRLRKSPKFCGKPLDRKAEGKPGRARLQPYRKAAQKIKSSRGATPHDSPGLQFLGWRRKVEPSPIGTAERLPDELKASAASLHPCKEREDVPPWAFS
jgi:hypothetical protein